MASDRRTLDIRAASAALAGGPPEEVTMAQIARTLGVAKPTLYRLATSRAELVSTCVETEAERLVEHLHAAFAPEEATTDSHAARNSHAARIDEALERFAADSPGGFALLFDAARPQARPAVRRAEDRLRELLRRTGSDAPSPSGPEAADAAALLGAGVARVRRRREDTGAATPRPGEARLAPARASSTGRSGSAGEPHR